MNIASFLHENIVQFGEYKQLIYAGPDGEVVLTNIDINNRASSLGASLKKLGICKGDVVGVILSNVPELPETINGVNRIGAIFMPIIFALTPPQIHYALEDSGARVLITEEKLWGKVSEAVKGLSNIKHIIVIGNVKAPNAISYKELVAEKDLQINVVEVAEDDLAILMYTAGTTGVPKGVMLTHGNLLASMRAGAQVWPYNHDTRGLTALPMNHIFGVSGCLESNVAGSTNILLPKFDALKVLEGIMNYKITIIGLVPTMISMLMEVYDPGKHNMKTIERIVSAGATLDREILEQAEKMFGVPIYQGYGMTEVGGAVSRQHLDKPRKAGSVGLPLPGVKLKIVDDDGNELPQGKDGEIICKGPIVMKGYYRKAVETAAALKNGWLHTGDIGKLDKEGELFITGRKKDLIIKGGENVDPGISENWLYKHPAIHEAAVIGIPDVKYGEEVAAAVVLKPGQKVTEQELISYMKEHVHYFYAPNRIFIFSELPKNTAGKILKNEIREKLKASIKI
ncbi:MAG: hypothetical protein EHM12_04410 [Dehalococcoidia bacterium]|nr:MAG: hypothetical protein EHM12_04410 [Dehalococcoidia bacterium]